MTYIQIFMDVIELNNVEAISYVSAPTSNQFYF